MIFQNWHRSVFGIYDSSAALHDAIGELKRSSFADDEVFFLISHSSEGGGFAHVRGSKAPEAALWGVITGGISGAIMGWRLGSEALNAAIPVMFAFAGAGLCGSVFGMLGALVGLAFPEYRAKRYQGALKNGGILLAVHVEDGFRKRKAKDILKQTGARFISVGSESIAGLKINISRPPKWIKSEVG
jgi:hypothetical protein